mmetsp:Transcript_12593/g.32994  ORF Transcript_12593/g.32994 Transcript_12593/m.32994 type:complete len:258 (-) Transcript_12593:97-870(-)
MVVALLHPHIERKPLGCARRLERLRLQLVHVAHQKVIRRALVDEDGERRAVVRVDQLDGVVRLARVRRAKVAREGLDAPRAVGRVADGREGRDRRVHARVLEVQRERAVAAHRVARDGLLARELIGERRRDDRRQLRRHVRVHVVVAGPLDLGGVHVEAGAAAKIVAVVSALDRDAARARIGQHDGEAASGRRAREAALLREVFVGAREAGQPVECRHRLLLRLRRQKHREGHLALADLGIVREPLEGAAHEARRTL